MSIAEALQKVQNNKEILEKLDQLNNKLLFMEQVNMKKNCMEQTLEIKLNRIEANINVMRKDIDVLLKEFRYTREYKKNKQSWLRKLFAKLTCKTR